MPLHHKDLLEISQLSQEDALEVVSLAAKIKSQLEGGRAYDSEVLSGRSLLTLFYEPSTRTRSSFEVAAKKAGMHVVHFDPDLSSIQKGETIEDTITTLESMGMDFLVVRHQRSGVPHAIAALTDMLVLNAGDGSHAHPTQALLDLFTLKEQVGELKGKCMLIVGDIKHSRVARSLCMVAKMFEMRIKVLAPPSLLPRHFWKEGALGLEVCRSWEEAMQEPVDVVYGLRVQKERQQVAYFPSDGEYHRVYGINRKRMEALQNIASDQVWLMHPGPVNRGVELSGELMYDSQCLIHQQVANGVPVRIAVMEWLLKKKGFR